MKRFLTIFSAVVLLVGCTNTDEFDLPINNKDANQLTSIYAGFADEERESRTYVENDQDILWQNGDALSLFYANCRNVKFQYNGESGASAAKFDFVPETGILGDKTLKNLQTHGLYPYYENATTEYDEASNAFNISTLFPTTQHYAPNSFGRGANVMVAASRGHYNELKEGPLYFRNACGYFTVKLYGEGVKVRSITLMARNGESIAGDATIRTHVDEDPVVTMAPGGLNYITLDCGEEGVALGVDEADATEFWFALPPVTLNGGVHLRVTATDGTVFKMETTKKIVIDRNKIQPMAALRFASNYNVVSYTRHTNQGTPFEWGDGTDHFDAKITAHYYDPVNKHIVVEFATPLTTIKENAFNGHFNTVIRDLRTMTLPNSLTTIGEDAFYLTGLVEFVCPGSVTYIGADAFYLCTQLKSVTFEPSPTNQPLAIECSDYGAPFDDGELTYINVNRAFKFMSGDEEVEPSMLREGLFANAADVTYPTRIVIGEQVPKIYNYMFAGLTMNKFDVPDHITEIGEGAFRGCPNITEFTIPATIESVGDDAFYGCANLHTIRIEDSDKPLPMGYSYETFSAAEWGPFYETPLKNIYMGRDIIQVDSDGIEAEADQWDEGLFVNKHYEEEEMILNVEIGPKVTRIRNYMFNYMKVGSINIAEGVTSIGIEAFRSCKKLASLTIPASVKTIDYDAFYDCSDLKILRVADGNTPLRIGYSYKGILNNTEYGPFYDSPLTQIYCGRNIVQVDDEGEPSPANASVEGVFTNCGYTNMNTPVKLDIGPQVTTISDYMFSLLCVQYVYFYPAITSIGKYAFNGCSVFEGLSCHHTTPPTLGASAFEGCDRMWYIRVPKDSMSAFKSAPGWKDYDRLNPSGKNFYLEQ